MPWRAKQSLVGGSTSSSNGGPVKGRRGRTRLTLFTRTQQKKSFDAQAERASMPRRRQQQQEDAAAPAALNIPAPLLVSSEAGVGGALDVQTETLSQDQSSSSSNPTSPLRRASASLMSGMMRMGMALMGGRDDAAAADETCSTGSERASMSEDRQIPAPAVSAHALPAGTKTARYTVRSGDTLAGVALRNGMTVGQLRQLNRIFGTDLYAGQTVLVRKPDTEGKTVSREEESRDNEEDEANDGDEDDDSCVEVPPSTPPASAWRSERRHSTLGGHVFDAVTLVDRNIRVLGVVEVNAFYVSFTPLRFAHAPGTVHDSHLTSSEALRLLRAYQFQLDVRDVQGVSAGRSRTASESAAAHSRAVTVGAIDAVVEEEDSDVHDDEADHEASKVARQAVATGSRLQLFWACAAAGFADPGPVVLEVQEEPACAEMTVAVQTQLHTARAKAARYEKLKIEQASSVTSGALLSGLLFRAEETTEDHVAFGTPAAFRRSRSTSFTDADAVQQRLLNGDITLAEADAIVRQAEEDARKMNDVVIVESAPVTKQAKHARNGSAGSAGSAEPVKPLARVEPRVLPRWLGPASNIVESDALLSALNGALPLRVHSKSWARAYDFDSCGVSLKLLYERARGRGDSLLLVRTTEGVVFGAFATEEWTQQRTREFYGTGESFVFRFDPATQQLRTYKWTGANDFIMSSSASHLAMGAGGGFAFCLNEDLDNGSCSPNCATFGVDAPLAGAQTFRVAELELIAFEMPVRRRLSVMSDTSEPRSLFEAEHGAEHAAE